jgi:curved DNA-binding protein CbpA/cell division septation protein DedD
MSPDAADLYSVLGVATQASPAEIRAAYLRMVRKHRPGSPGFQGIHQAYEVLKDDESRERYDQAKAVDPEARALADQARALIDKEDAAAVPLVKRALMRQPEAVWLRDLLTQALVVAKDLQAAETQARKVLAAEPASAPYLVRLGDVLRDRDKDAEALPYYRQALALDRSNPQHAVKVAVLLNYLDRYEEAVRLLEESIGRDGKVDFDDFVYFQCLCRIHAFRERFDQLEATHERIRKMLPASEESRSEAAWFFYTNALMMARLGRFEAAVRSIDQAAALDSSLPDLSETVERLRRNRSALAELELLQADAKLDEALKAAVAALAYWRTLGEDKELKAVFDRATEGLSRRMSTEGTDIGAQLRAIETRYPTLAALLADMLSSFKQAAARAPKLFIELVCPYPGCGTRAHTRKPTVESLAESGISRSQAAQLILAVGERGILQRITFTCDTCHRTYNGLSQPAGEGAASPRPSPPRVQRQEPARPAPPRPKPASPKPAPPKPAPQASPGPPQPKPGPCFVVTAACGDESAYPVRVLRSYRDDELLERAWGRAAARLYQRIGPLLARAVAASPRLRRIAFVFCERIARRVARRPVQPARAAGRQ